MYIPYYYFCLGKYIILKQITIFICQIRRRGNKSNYSTWLIKVIRPVLETNRIIHRYFRSEETNYIFVTRISKSRYVKSPASFVSLETEIKMSPNGICCLIRNFWQEMMVMIMTIMQFFLAALFLFLYFTLNSVFL